MRALTARVACLLLTCWVTACGAPADGLAPLLPPQSDGATVTDGATIAADPDLALAGDLADAQLAATPESELLLLCHYVGRSAKMEVRRVFAEGYAEAITDDAVPGDVAFDAYYSKLWAICDLRGLLTMDVV